MPSLAKNTALAALLLGSLAAPARSQSESFSFDYYCTMGSMAACASVRIQSVDNVLTMQVWNLNGTMGVAHTITDIGLYHAGYDWAGAVNNTEVTYVTGSGSTDISSYWNAFAASDIQSLGGVNVELSDGTWFGDLGQGISGCTDTSDWLANWSTCWNGSSSFDGQPFVQFTFNLDSHFALNDLQLRWKSAGQDQYTYTCDTGGAGDLPACRYRRPTSVPEPGTIALVGTGLLGVAGYVRRRRKSA